MKLNPKSVVTKIFLFCHEISRRFAGEKWYKRPQRTDICQLIRMIFLWGPLTLAAHLVLVATVMFTTIYYPIQVFEWAYGWFWIVVGVTLLAITCGILIIRGFYTIRIKMPQAAKDVCAIATAGYRGFKEKFCPIIEFGENT